MLFSIQRGSAKLVSAPTPKIMNRIEGVWRNALTGLLSTGTAPCVTATLTIQGATIHNSTSSLDCKTDNCRQRLAL